jgi:hypothetical protein
MSAWGSVNNKQALLYRRMSWSLPLFKRQYMGGGYYHRSLIIRNRRASTVLISNCAAGKQLSQVIRNTSFYCGVLGPWMIF